MSDTPTVCEHGRPAWRSPYREILSDLDRGLAKAKAYAEKLAEGLPCLPKDVEVLRQANGDLAQRNYELERELAAVTEALLLYHEAWNGCEGDWKAAMAEASKVADSVMAKAEKEC